jgi:hypothetical protein
VFDSDSLEKFVVNLVNDQVELKSYLQEAAFFGFKSPWLWIKKRSSGKTFGFIWFLSVPTSFKTFGHYFFWQNFFDSNQIKTGTTFRLKWKFKY